MAERRRYVYPAAALALTAALGWWLAADRREREPPTAGADARERPRYYLRDATLSAYEADGRRSTRVTASRVEYFARDDRWELTEPRWEGARDDGGRPWRGRSERGRLTDAQRHARLRGEVTLTTTGARGPVTLHTQALSLDLVRDYAETDRPVRLSAPHWWMRGTGGRFWLSEQRLRLLADVEGSYAPP